MPRARGARPCGQRRAGQGCQSHVSASARRGGGGRGGGGRNSIETAAVPAAGGFGGVKNLPEPVGERGPL